MKNFPDEGGGQVKTFKEKAAARGQEVIEQRRAVKEEKRRQRGGGWFERAKNKAREVGASISEMKDKVGEKITSAKEITVGSVALGIEAGRDKMTELAEWAERKGKEVSLKFEIRGVEGEMKDIDNEIAQYQELADSDGEGIEGLNVQIRALEAVKTELEQEKAELVQSQKAINDKIRKVAEKELPKVESELTEVTDSIKDLEAERGRYQGSQIENQTQVKSLNTKKEKVKAKLEVLKQRFDELTKESEPSAVA